MTPRLFVAVSSRRSLALLAAGTVAVFIAMTPAMATMGDHGATVTEWETAGSVERMAEILDEWGEAGERAAWWQLALDVPFVIGFGLFFAGACTAVAARAAATGRTAVRRAAVAAAWLGPIAAGADLVQDASLALVLAGHVAQPWVRIAALTAPFIVTFVAGAALVAALGVLLTRKRATVEGADRGAAP
jgi:hypothetical protein